MSFLLFTFLLTVVCGWVDAKVRKSIGGVR